MKYFKPELIVMGRSEDERVLNEQERLWEVAGEEYVTYLDTVRSMFPPGLRHIDESYYLHDAVIQGMGRRGPSFVMMLQLDPPPQSLLTFTYDLVEDPVIIEDALPGGQREAARHVEWQYDEIERVAGDPCTWRQAILLSNGWEVTLHFRDVRGEEVQAVLPPPRSGVVPGVSFVLQNPTQA